MKAKQVFFLTLLAIASPKLAAQEVNFDLIRDGIRSSREAIHTLHVKFQRVDTVVFKSPNLKPTRPATATVEWWQDGDTVQWEEDCEIPAPTSAQKVVRIKTTAIIRDGEITIASSQQEINGLFHKGGEKGLYNEDEHISTNVWYQSLFLVTGRPSRSLADLLASDEYRKGIMATHEGGQHLYKLNLLAPHNKIDGLEVWVDPKHNFLVKRLATKPVSENTVGRIEREVLSFQQPEQGIYFPQDVEMRFFCIKKDKEERLEWH